MTRALRRPSSTGLNGSQPRKGYAALDRRDFVTFNAGLLLRELLKSHSVDVEALAEDQTLPAARTESWPIAHAWPEGFICTNYCLCILAAVLDQEGTPLTLPALADDLRTWWSYRENVAEDPAQAIAFLDLLTGNEPNWFMPDSVTGRTAMKRAIAAQILPIASPGGFLIVLTMLQMYVTPSVK